MLTSVKDRSIIVTGAGSGIGKSIARTFAKHGAKILVVGRTEETLAATAEAISEAGGTASYVVGDVSSWDDMQAVAATAADRHGGVDTVCANAAIHPHTKLEDLEPEEWDQVMGTNLKGAFLCVKACLPHLKKSDYGRVVLTSSVTGPITALPGWTHHCATKSGMLGFMRSACMELGKHGITVNAILPGIVMTEKLMELGEDTLKRMAAEVPLNRLAKVEEVAHAALFLASREAGYITGHSLVIDGGMIIPEVH